MDNVPNAAPVIPQGTQPTIYGTASFQGNQGQAASMPNQAKPEPAPQQQETQPGQQNAPEGITFQELAVKKGFKSPDDLAKAYSNLESHNKGVEMSLSDALRARQESLPAEELNQPVQTDEDALKVVEKIVQRAVRPIKDELALSELMRQHPDVQQFAPAMAKLVKENPGISWEVAYKAAKFDHIGPQAKQEGQKEAYQAIQNKQTVAVGEPKATTKESRPLDELVRDKNIPFIEVQRIMREKFSQ